MPAAAMRVLVGRFNGDEIQITVADARLGRDRGGEFLDIARAALQYHRFKAGLVIEVDMHRCDGEVMMGVLLGRETFR